MERQSGIAGGSSLENAASDATACERMRIEGDESSFDGRTSRLEKVIGAEGLARLGESTVMVFGLGGVGSSCVEALARGGVGSLVLIDGDAVQESNINRQAIAFYSTIGRRKTDVMRAMIADINPQARVEVRDLFVFPSDVEALLDEFASRLDYVIDAIDTVSSKLALARCAQSRGLPLVSAMGAANRVRPDRFAFADLYDTKGCPLCRAMRKEARKQGIERLRVIYSDEALPADSERKSLGTMSYAPPIMGQMIAGDVICSLLGMGEGDAL